ncbi:MFS transporter [Dactylosporangium sp. CA-139066]|uniref:MFS transporter n=1 Tax=Dactylosporangium sp. CA-139066 TaxID=3239930 RepID=UPI003D8F6BB4
MRERSAAAIFLVALCLRPAITTVGPLLQQIGAGERLGETLLGLLGALPLLAFAVVSPLVHRVSGPLGAERSILAALLVLAAGCVARSYTGAPGLWLGTLVIGTAIAVGNVLVPVIIRRDYAAHVSRATGFYTAAMTLAASTASALAVPLAAASNWRAALAIWALLAVAVAAVWLPRARAARPAAAAAAATPAAGPAAEPAHPSVWRQPAAWLITAFMGLQSTTYYVLVTWLPTIDAASGADAQTAGLHLFVFQVLGIAGGLAIPLLLRRSPSLTGGAVVACAPMLAGVLGLLLAPGLTVVWAVVAGLGQGACLVVALSLISLRGRTHREATHLSGMAQSVGYLLAACGPVAAGTLAEHTGGWRAALVLLAALAVAQLTFGALAGRQRAAAAEPAVAAAPSR